MDSFPVCQSFRRVFGLGVLEVWTGGGQVDALVVLCD